ncbi:MAG: aminotransferase class V-fold PLP-dependent enzyme, partial [Proteobacteria bacterium]|nr:aminotransferase class V-fold PLP-dependent enzyme [Pseudomonadota bacterium]
FHTDAAQAAGKIPVDVHAQNIDMLSLSGHKMYGPKGIGALYVSRPLAPILEPLIIGGAQQGGLRAGTVPTFLCAGLGAACRIAAQDMEMDRAHCLALRAAFLETLTALLPDIADIGDRERRLPGNLNIRFPGVDADSLLTALHGQVSASTGSACNAGLIEPSYVLRALGLNSDQINSSIRFGFGRQSTIEEIIWAAKIIADKAISLSERLAVA